MKNLLPSIRLMETTMLPSIRFMETTMASVGASALTKDYARMLRLLQLTSAANQVGWVSAALSQSLRSVTDVYLQAIQRMSRPDVSRAFLGTQDLFDTLRLAGPIFDQPDLLARLVGDTRPAIGSLALGMDLQLSPSILAALASRTSLRGPYLAERSGWKRWVPSHPKTLTRTGAIQTEWLLGETHNAAQASVAALGRGAEGTNSAEISAAATGVTREYPDLLGMQVPGTGRDLRTSLMRVDSRLAESIEGALRCLREGGPDCGKQAAASLRAGLDQLAAAMIPGSKKKGRRASYAVVLGVAGGDTEGTLLYHQIGILDTAHLSLSRRVHDQDDDDALCVVAFGIFSALAAVLSRWAVQAERPLP
ncbi:MAG TPA: hypothetical protein VNF24_04445 [Candidatus Acidoferrales bacterium]|nr:hypothetical protein [Candidatus Acidoferrales bacterium]